MIVLSGGGANFGLPEVSPFVTKTEVQLKMAGLSFEKRKARPQEAPKGQIPFIDDGGKLIGDSTFIRMHIEAEYGIDLDAGLSPAERAQAMAVEMMCELQLAPAVTYFRWLVPANFEIGPARFFDDAPEAIRAKLIADVLERVRESFIARGIARHSVPEITALARRQFAALSVLIGDKAYLMGEEPHAADAFVFATLAAAMTPYFDSPLHEIAVSYPNLVAYVSRMMDRFYPEFEWDAGIGIAAKAA